MTTSLLITFLLGILVGGSVEHIRVKLQRRAWRSRGRSQLKGANLAREPVASSNASAELPRSEQIDAADQLRIVLGAEFFLQPVLSRSEARVFRELDQIVLSRNPDWQVMAQVSLGEILRCRDQVAYSCINSKRVDLLIVDENCRPRHAVEYQGRGHYQREAAARDAVKKEALRRAGISYHEVIAGQTTPSDLRQLFERLVDMPASAHLVDSRARG